MSIGYVLQRKSDGMYFCDAYTNENREEWTEKPKAARIWIDHQSCCAAAKTWLAIKGEPLDVVFYE